MKLSSASASAEPDTQQVQREQALRKRRFGMAGMSYMLTLILVLYARFQDLMPAPILLGFAALTAMVNLTVYLLLHKGINLRFNDPSMTAMQMVVSLVPA